MATLLSSIETQSRRHLSEATASFWSSAEIIDIINQGLRDLWRSVADLKQEHHLTNDTTSVTMPASTSILSGVPGDVHKVYLIEPLDTSTDSDNKGLVFKPLDYNHRHFQSARTLSAIDPSNDVIFYAPTGAGGPTGASSTVIYVAPQVTSAVTLRFVYVPTLVARVATDIVPIAGEADNALIAWTVAFARAKEREDRSPDPGWLAIYATEKQSLLQSLGMRQYHEPMYVDALFEEHW